MEDELLNAAEAAVEDAIVEEETATVLHADALAKAEAADALAAAAEELAAEAVVEESVAEELDDMAVEDRRVTYEGRRGDHGAGAGRSAWRSRQSDVADSTAAALVPN